MSALITSALLTPCGKITNPTLGGYVDAAGNIVGSPSFLPNYVVDVAGNLGTVTVAPPITNCTFDVTIIGSAFEPGPWENQVGTTETVGTNGSTDPANYATPFSSFASANTTGYNSGRISGSGIWTVQGGTQSIGGVAYPGGGLIVSTGNNTIGGTTVVETGARLQVGLDESNTLSKLANLTVQAGGEATVMGAYTANTYATQALNNTGVTNFTGPDVCGQGIMLSTTVANNGVINLKDSYWRNQSTWSGTGTVNVLEGGTFATSTNAIGSTTRVNINGCGWCNSAGVQVGAINMIGAAVTLGMRIHVQSAACIKANAGANTTFSGIVSGSAPLTVTTLNSTKPNGTTHFTNTANTYFGTMTVDGTALNASYGNSLQYAKVNLVNGGYMASSASQSIGSLSGDSTSKWQSSDFQSHYIKANGVTQFDGKLLWNGGSNTANWYLDGPATNELTMTSTGNTGNIYPRNGARLILQGATWTGTNGQVRVQTGGTVSAGTSTTAACTYLLIDATSKLEVRAAGAGAGLMNVGTVGLALSAGWKVDLPDVMAPGVYPIISSRSAATTVLPTTGMNNTGLTATYAWNNAVLPRILNMTLA